jgi:hypothetical protein
MPIKRSQTPAPSHAARCLRAGASAAAAATVSGPGSPASVGLSFVTLACRRRVLRANQVSLLMTRSLP